LRTHAISERLRGVFTTRRYTNFRLPLPLPLPFCSEATMFGNIKLIKAAAAAATTTTTFDI